jgi:diaminohydroxyphosphoribosylaminopyrimidine deaminase/5-amino-6-(5-phosphoribosylamino)uracil reductase
MTAAHSDEHWMRQALKLAKCGQGSVSPNPLVGAVIVKANRLIASGYHAAYGGDHAEVVALSKAGKQARGATIYVTLEPCCHWGKTPPCTKAIIEAGISRVVFAQTDPNPKVKDGNTIKILQDAGIGVSTGVLSKQAEALNYVFSTTILTGRPFVTLKLGLTIDGMIADRQGSSKWITNDRSRGYVQKLRLQHDAILVGIGTALADDPELTVRDSKSKQPVRVVLDPQLLLPVTARMLGLPGKTIVITQKLCCDTERAASLQNKGVTLVGLKTISDQFDIDEVLRELSSLGIWSVLVEGGGGVAHAFELAGRINRYEIFKAPKIMSDIRSKHGFSGESGRLLSDISALSLIKVRRFGDDVLLVYEPKKLS